MMRTSRLGIVAVIATSVMGCFAEEAAPNPITFETPEIPEPTPPGEVRRTVETRNPFGGTVGNLLVDGGFETSIVLQRTSSQSGWLAFGNGETYLRGATGGHCRAGLRCGWLDPQVLLFGRGAAAKDSGMIASVWSKPPEGFGCNSVRAQILRCNSFEAAANLQPQSELPGPDGWCFHRGRVGRQTTGTCMLLESSVITDAILIDDAAVIPDTGVTPLSKGGATIPSVTFQPLTGERKERVRALLEWNRKRMLIGAPLQGHPNIGLK